MTFPVSVQTIILISFQNREVYIISTSKRLTVEAALCSSATSVCLLLHPSCPGQCDKWQGRSLGKTQGKPFWQVLGLWYLCAGIRTHPLPNTKHFPVGSRCVGCSGAPSCGAQPWVLWMSPVSAQDLQALPGGLARCLNTKCHQDRSCFQQNPYPVQRQQTLWLRRPRITRRAFTSPIVMYKIPKPIEIMNTDASFKLFMADSDRSSKER